MAAEHLLLCVLARFFGEAQMITDTDLQNFQKIFEEGLSFLGEHLKKREEVRLQSKKVYGPLMDAHWLAISVIANAISKVSGKPGKADPSLAQLLSLSASFIQGIDICESAISEGLYVSAAALLKQEMETVAAIDEVRRSVRISGKTPNVKMFGKLSVLYGDLNKIAHVSDSNLMQQLITLKLSESTAGAPILPVFNEELAKLFYGLHVALMAMLAIQIESILIDLYGIGYNNLQKRMLSRVGGILQAGGWIKSDS